MMWSDPPACPREADLKEAGSASKPCGCRTTRISHASLSAAGDRPGPRREAITGTDPGHPEASNRENAWADREGPKEPAMALQPAAWEGPVRQLRLEVPLQDSVPDPGESFLLLRINLRFPREHAQGGEPGEGGMRPAGISQFS